MVQWKNYRRRKKEEKKESWEYGINETETVRKRMKQICNSESIYKRVEIIQAWNSYVSRSGNNIFRF